MERCSVCGNDYDKCISITMHGKTHVFDCFECAIHALAPTCEHCECKIIGHGTEGNGKFYCCAHCAKNAGLSTIQDRA